MPESKTSEKNQNLRHSWWFNIYPFLPLFNMEHRTAEINRKTNETDIQISLNLDDKFDQKINIDTGIGFLDHVCHA